MATISVSGKGLVSRAADPGWIDRSHVCQARDTISVRSDSGINPRQVHWDLQIGRDEDVWPDRIRIQVKNSARLQTWNALSGKVSDCQFDLNYRSRPFYFERDFPAVPCEEHGFLCDVFLLCYHPETDRERVDHTDPQQWRFYVVPVNGPSAGVTETEVAWAETQFLKGAKSVKLQRRPGTLEAGIRGRRAIKARRLGQLVADQLFDTD